MIQLNDLEIGYTTKKQKLSIFKNLTMGFESCELVGIMGDNGVGKSTLLKTLNGTIKALSGTVQLNGKNINEYSSLEIAQYLSIVITEKVSGFNLTAWDVVASGRTPYINVFGKLEQIDINIVEASLQKLNLISLKHKLMDELSDGQRQKIMIAKSLAQQTPVIVLDEPTAFLDYNSKHRLFNVLKELCITEQKLIIVSSHDLDLMRRYITKGVTMHEGNRLQIY